jgi:hypothetical protein
MVRTADTPLPAVAGYSVADLARRWKVGEDKVRGWINAGALVAVNVADNLCGRPLWRVTPEALAAFERGRQSGTPAKTRRRRQTVGVDYFPD